MDNLNELKTAEEMRKIAEDALSSKKMEELIEEYYKRISDAINLMDKNGNFRTSIIVHEDTYSEAICQRISEMLKEKGFNTEIRPCFESSFTLFVMW